ncbi:MAG: hypothetical protein ABS894_00885 [Aerococcus urinaeequi]
MVYQNFEVNDPAKIQVWEMLLRDESYDAVQAMAVEHCKTSKFPPVPADLIPQKEPLSIYDIQEIEQKEQQLALEAYHRDNDVKPMPDYILRELKLLGMDGVDE